MRWAPPGAGSTVGRWGPGLWDTQGVGTVAPLVEQPQKALVLGAEGRWQLVGNEKWPKVEDTVSNRGSSRRKTVSREGFKRSVWTERKV